ncbi:ABC transporter permease [Bacteroidota bacterium]
MRKNQSPPKIAGWLLNRFLLRNEDLEKLGDLEEGFWIKVEEDGILKAKLWYCWQALIAIPISIKNSISWGIIMFQNYFKIAVRNIKKYKAYSTINILGLAAGMACCILILLWVQNELSYDNFHENGDDIYRVTIDWDGNVGSWSSWALLSYLKNDFPEIEKGSWFYDDNVNVKYNGLNYNENITLVVPEFFEMFTFPFLKGDPATAIADLNSVVISERMALKFLGDEDPIGKTLHLDNSIDLTVTGVMENVPLNSHMEFDLVARPEVFLPKERFGMWRMDCPTYIQLTAGTNYKETIEKIWDTIIKYNSQSPTKWIVGLQPLKEIHLYSLNGTHPITYVYIFAGVAFMVLLIACINFMNLSTARSALRAKEIGMRKVIGANRNDVVKQFFSESVILSFIALIISIMVVYVLLPAFNEIAETQLVFNPVQNPSLMGGLILIAFITGIISGIYPSLYLSSFQPVTILKNIMSKGGKGRVLRRGLIIFQFTIAIILIICTSIILKQMYYIMTKDIGFDRENIVTIRMDDKLLGKYEIIKEELNNYKDIANVSAACNLPVRIGGKQGTYWEGVNREDMKMFDFIVTDYNYFKTFDMQITYGRSFSKDHLTDTENFIINETALKMTGFEDPIGKTLWAGKPGKIIGVVKDFHATSFHNEINPAVFMMWEVLPKRNLFVKINNHNIPATISYIEDTIDRLSPGFIFEYNFMDDHFNRIYKRETNLQTLLQYFTILAIFISCLGLIGLASFMAEQKTKEIAIRKVLGAKTIGVMTQLSKEFVMLVLAANIVAWPVAFYFMSGWIEDFTYRTNIGAIVFILSAIIAISIAIITVSFQAFKAANANPVDSLKNE